MTIRDVLIQGSANLKSAGIESASLDASLLLAHVLNVTRTALAAMGPDVITDEALNAFRDLAERRGKGECAAYILGKKEFRNLEFFVNSSVLVPRPDTETLVEAAIKTGSEKWGKENKIRVLDLCTGSGAIAISLKHEMPHLEVCASDISPDAVKIAKQNAAKLLPYGSDIKFFQGELFDALPAEYNSRFPAFHIIACNPPYIPSNEINTLCAEVRNEPRLALDGGKTGLEIIERIIEKAPNYLLVGGGVLLMEADPGQMEKIASLLERRGFNDIILYRDLSGFNRVIGGKFEK